MTPIPDDQLFSSPHVERLLGRPLQRIPLEAGLKTLTGASVLVTGAGGSVGRALVARLVQLPVDRIVALDHHEASLFHLARELPLDRLHPVLADVRNREKIDRVLTEHQPQVVFHLAAYKHVPLAERGPDEFVAVNILATEGLAQAGREAGVRHFVYPSSDKAVNPPSAYGATKRLAETAVLAAERPPFAPHVVRYVNILGTAGSWPETVAREARRGAALQLTDERMARYWMAMDEAIDLLIHSLGLPAGSRTILDTGGPVATRAIGERIARLVRPDLEPRFVMVGPRPGERLIEELVSPGERLERGGADPVLQIVRSDHDQTGAIAAAIDELRRLLSVGNEESLHRRLLELAHQLQ